VDLPLLIQLALILAKGLRASTKYETIVIYDNPRRASWFSLIMFANIAEALEYILLFEDIKPFKVQIYNIRLNNGWDLGSYWKFLKLVELVDLRFESKKTECFLITLFRKTLSLIINL
jgi:hypothetical protein